MIAKFGKSQQYIYPVHTPDRKKLSTIQRKDFDAESCKIEKLTLNKNFI